MDIIDVDKLEFFHGYTYDDYHVSRHGSFIYDVGRKVANENTITIYQGCDDIVFVTITGFTNWRHSFIIEGMNFDINREKNHISIIVARHNQIIRNKTIDNLLG